MINMAHAYRKLGRDDDALVGFRRFLELDPKNAQVHYEIAQILIDRGDFGEAPGELQQALQVEPKMAAARNALGVVALNKGRSRRGRNGDSRRPRLEARRAAGALQPGAARREAGRHGDRAGGIPEGARAASGTISRPPSTWGSCTKRSVGPAEQEAAYRQAIAINADFGEGYFYLAKLLLDQGQRFDEAVALAKKGLEVAPKSSYAPLGHYVLADLYSRMGRPADAAAEAKRAKRSNGAAANRAVGG